LLAGLDHLEDGRGLYGVEVGRSARDDDEVGLANGEGRGLRCDTLEVDDDELEEVADA